MKKHRALFLSDIHLGNRHCKIDVLMQFLYKHVNKYPEKIYLVGDIFDLQEITRWHWTPRHNEFIGWLLKAMREETQIEYIVGNHEVALNAFIPYFFGNLSLVQSSNHHTKEGKVYKVIHGHQFDSFLYRHPLLGTIGGYSYDRLVDINGLFYWVQKKFGVESPKSFSLWVKRKTKKLTKVVDKFMSLGHTAYPGHDGVITGHIHSPCIIYDDSGDSTKAIMNCGDWIESCSAIVERHDGEFELIRM